MPDGFSDVIAEIFQEQGQHARAVSGASALAFHVPTMVESIVAV